jgi:hypothetical protein
MEAFKIKNGLSAKRYLGSNGTETASSVGYDLAGASYDNKSFSVSSQTADPYGITFNSSGTKMYVLGNDNDIVYQYSLSTAWDVSTSSYDSVTLNVSSQDAAPLGICIGDNDTKLYLVGGLNDSIFQYNLSTASDLSTASYANKSFNLSAQFGSPYDVVFKTDGSSFYVAGITPASFSQYNLTTSWDVSTATFDSSFDPSTQDTNALSITFNADGTKLYSAGAANDSVFQYSLTTAWDLSTISYDNISFSVTAQDTVPLDVSFKSGGTKMYISGAANDTIYQYSTALLTQTLDLATGTTFSFTPSGATTVSFTNPPASGNAIGFSVEINGDGSAITWPSSVKWPAGVAPTATATKELYTFVTTDGGTTYYGKKAAEGVA